MGHTWSLELHDLFSSLENKESKVEEESPSQRLVWISGERKFNTIKEADLKISHLGSFKEKIISFYLNAVETGLPSDSQR